MRFRQVHLDFHTSELIPGIGSRFDKKQFQDMLKLGCVDSITVFAKCHHGWAYHPSTVYETHPHLKFDLLGAMIEAAHEIGVKTPIYISAGLDERLARRHPEWLRRGRDERTSWAPNFMEPGYHEFCFNTPYLDELLRQIEEVTRNYDGDGLFLDIVGVRECYCQHCVASVRAEGGDPRNEEQMRPIWERTYARYAERVRELVHSIRPGYPIFHNSGHVRRGRRDLVFVNTHLELESLPTGGWGYDHFPLSARYAQQLGLNFLGMTGKFHTNWGEFGGFKHPNALRYETALSIANGARCSIGDQLHPLGEMDPATYALIGEAYREVKAKEAWCVDTRNVADVALLSLEVFAKKESKVKTGATDAGAVRILLEGKVLFDVVDTESDWSGYKVLVLPDDVRIDEALLGKLKAFLAGGGKLLATGCSGLDPEGKAFKLDFGLRYIEPNPYKPDYFRPNFELKSLAPSTYVFYSQGQRVELTASGTELGRRVQPYFNRDAFAFSSHQHTPYDPEKSETGMAEGPDGIYIAWNVFEDYATMGSITLKETVLYALDRLLGESRTLTTSLPAQGVVTVQEQPAHNRLVVHLLYASPVRRGVKTEVIEDIVPLYDVDVSVSVAEPAKRVYLAPQDADLPYEQKDGRIRFTVPKLDCHQMIVIER